MSSINEVEIQIREIVSQLREIRHTKNFKGSSFTEHYTFPTSSEEDTMLSNIEVNLEEYGRIKT